RARRMTDCPNSPSMRATVGSATLHLTLASLAGFPAASRRSAKNPALSPTTTVADSGETVTDATGPGLRPGIESPEESTAAARSPSGAVRIVDQRALPEAKIERDLESGEAVADAIRTLQLRGAPLIGIAAAMGLVAGMRELRAAPRDRFLARLDELARLLAAT